MAATRKGAARAAKKKRRPRAPSPTRTRRTQKPPRAATKTRTDRSRSRIRKGPKNSRAPTKKTLPKPAKKAPAKPTRKERAARERKNARARVARAEKRAREERAFRKAERARKRRNAERRAARASEKRQKEEAKARRRARQKAKLARKLAAATKKIRVPKKKKKPVPVESPTQKPWRRRTAEDIPKRKVPEVVRQVHSAGEVLLDRLLKYRDRLAGKGGIAPPDGHQFGERWATFSEHVGGRVGMHRSVPIMLPILESTLEEITYKVMAAAKEVHAALPQGKIYASLHLLEYGRRLAGSPGEMYFDDGAGFFVQSFEGVPGSNLPQFEIRLRRVLERLVCTDRSAVFLEHVIVRAYQERVGHAGRVLTKPGPRRKPRRKK